VPGQRAACCAGGGLCRAWVWIGLLAETHQVLDQRAACGAGGGPGGLAHGNSAGQQRAPDLLQGAGQRAGGRPRATVSRRTPRHGLPWPSASVACLRTYAQGRCGRCYASACEVGSSVVVAASSIRGPPVGAGAQAGTHSKPAVTAFPGCAPRAGVRRGHLAEQALVARQADRRRKRERRRGGVRPGPQRHRALARRGRHRAQRGAAACVSRPSHPRQLLMRPFVPVPEAARSALARASERHEYAAPCPPRHRAAGCAHDSCSRFKLNISRSPVAAYRAAGC